MRAHLELTTAEKAVFGKLTREERNVVIEQLIAQLRDDIAHLVMFGSGVLEQQLTLPEPPKTPPPPPRPTPPSPTVVRTLAPLPSPTPPPARTLAPLLSSTPTPTPRPAPPRPTPPPTPPARENEATRPFRVVRGVISPRP